jgi:hypothetical protein
MINASNQYDVRGDIDLDGDADSTDKSAVQALGAVTRSLAGHRC